MANDVEKELLDLARDIRALAALHSEAGGTELRMGVEVVPSPKPPSQAASVMYENASARMRLGADISCPLVMVVALPPGNDTGNLVLPGGGISEMLDAMQEHVLQLPHGSTRRVVLQYRTRRPDPGDVRACGAALRAACLASQPKAVLCFGVGAARTLLGDRPETRNGLGRWLDCEGIPVLTTHSPTELLDRPGDKRAAFQHLQRMRERLQ